jgi:hypothetical protein
MNNVIKKADYVKMRGRYLPKTISAIFVLESPPAAGRYFYNPNGQTTEPLFSAMMRLIKCKPVRKASGLTEFAKRRFIIVDATYTPVNHIKNRTKRDQVILKSYLELVKDLRAITKNKKTPIILVKANICDLLADPLKKDGFNIINNDIRIPFPAFGQQNIFRQRMRRVLKEAGINIKP